MYERCMEVMPAVAKRATTLGVTGSEGAYLYTEDGRRLLDFASGVAVNNIGCRNERVVAAIKDELDNMIHVGHNVVYYESYVALAEKLVELTGGDTKVYFSNSGAEANEGQSSWRNMSQKDRGLSASGIPFTDARWRQYPLPVPMRRTGNITNRCFRQFTGRIMRTVTVVRSDRKKENVTWNVWDSLNRFSRK